MTAESAPYFAFSAAHVSQVQQFWEEFFVDNKEVSAWLDGLNLKLNEGDFVTIIGGKTGTTDKAGNCLILLSEDEAGNRYVSVVMGADSKDHLYTDMTTLLEGGVAAAGQSSENTE